MILWFALGCGSAEPVETVADSPTVEIEAVDGLVYETTAALSGQITWNVTFDEVGLELGHVDCVYQRTYEGLEDWSRWHLCPGCEAMFATEIEMPLGREDCYPQITPEEPSPSEFIGAGSDAFWRHYDENNVLTEQGAATLQAGGMSTLNEAGWSLDDGAGFTFFIEGNFELTEVQDDPYHGLRPPDVYRCGWRKTSPPAYEGDYQLAVGEVLPDAIVGPDQCGQGLRLHDLSGEWLVVIVGLKAGCQSCRAAAFWADDFVVDMASAGVGVQVVTLLRGAEDDNQEPLSKDQIAHWASYNDVHQPVAGDRGYGAAVVGAVEGFQYPTVVVVSPELVVVEVQLGFTSWDSVEEVLLSEI